MEVARYGRENREAILIGHAGHPEVEGTMGQYASAEGAIYLVENPEDVARLQVRHPERLVFVTQTTLSMDDTARVIDALRMRFPGIGGPKKDDICYATQNRQDAVKELSRHCDLLLVVGSVTSSNSNRLREIAEQQGIAAYLIDGAVHIRDEWMDGVETVGVTAGASAPEVLVEEVIARLKSLGATRVEEYVGREENVTFSLPKDLQRAVRSSG